jgi:hypothetical protein
VSAAPSNTTVRPIWIYALMPALCVGQSAATSPKKDVLPNAWIRGTVLSELTGEPLTRARVLLKSASGEAANVAAECDERGNFVIPNVIPGKYSITAQRDGYLPSASARGSGTRLPAVIDVEAGKSLSDVTLRLKRWSVIGGRIRFDDAEPAIGVLVQVFQASFARGRRSFRMVSFTRTDDRGQYRVAGLAPGSYFVAASYDRPVPDRYVQADRVDEAGQPLPQFRYATTFYPSALKLADALPLRIGAAEEADGIDLFLQQVRTVTIRGIAISGLSGEAIKSPNVSLRRLSADAHASINAAVSVAPRRDGFEIRGVASGSYLVVADSMESRMRLFAQTPLVVTDANIDDLHLMLEPERIWRGKVNASDTQGVSLSSLRVVLEPRSDLNPITSADVDAHGNFAISVVPDETYDAYVMNTPGEVYIKSIRVATSTVNREGISGRMAGSSQPIEIALSSKDGTLSGRVWNMDGSGAPGATVTVVPDPPDGRPQYYRTGFADQFGTVQVRGLAPGRYTAYAYYDDAPCDFFDTDALAECATQGFGFTASESTQTVMALRLAK